MNDRISTARDDLEQRLRLALTDQPAYTVRQVGRREVRVARPHDFKRESTPYRFTLLVREKRGRVETVEHWSTDGDTPRRLRDREQPVRDTIATVLAEAGWKQGRGFVGWTIAVVKEVTLGLLLTAIVVAICAFLAR
ncbi:hypothetical protein NN3_15370 [Nocardia neocaledoniensis NBRC 108232]|nr:hypothetical protein NN3_15370 [Nocardia neocaledoniensis NBRC 108232]